MQRTANIATNPIRSLRIALFTMMAFAAALVGPQTYADNCDREDAASVAAYNALVAAAQERSEAVAAYATAVASGNPYTVVWASLRLSLANASFALAGSLYQAASDASTACDAANSGD